MTNSPPASPLNESECISESFHCDNLDIISSDEDTLRLLTQHLATSPPIIHSTLKPKSVFFPTNSKGPYRVVFVDLVKLCNSKSASKSHNLLPCEFRALNTLMHAEDLIIKTTDKRGGIVLQNKVDYIQEAERLSDQATYTKLKKDPTCEFAKEADTLISTTLTDGIITKIESSFLCKPFYSVPYFYHFYCGLHGQCHLRLQPICRLIPTANCPTTSVLYPRWNALTFGYQWTLAPYILQSPTPLA